tara:strand:+ start:1314 stop:1550 length:237 start_codon:yes stop_codon:yes gene_type:complete
MRTGLPLIIIGTIMFIIGLAMFYSIQMGQTNSDLRLVKNMGTFIGLIGIGVTFAGIIIFLINRNTSPIQENFDVENKE